MGRHRLLRFAVLATLLFVAAGGVVLGRAWRWSALSEATSERGVPVLAGASELPLAEAGPHAGGWRQVTVVRADGGTFPAVLYYPAQTRGEEAPVDPEGAPYPAIAFGHGFLQTPQRYDRTLEHLATWGYFLIAPQSHTGLAPSHSGMANDLLASLAWLEEQHGQAGSWLRGQVDSHTRGLLGHSMGGGASLLAVAIDPSLSAVATLAAADTAPSAAGGLTAVRTPLAFLVGSEDRLVPPSRTAALYRSARPPKQLVTILGGSHCGFQDDPFPIGCDHGSLARSEQLAITRARLTAFFGLYLKGDQALDPSVWGPPNDGRVTLLAERESASPLGAYLPLGLIRP